MAVQLNRCPSDNFGKWIVKGKHIVTTEERALTSRPSADGFTTSRVLPLLGLVLPAVVGLCCPTWLGGAAQAQPSPAPLELHAEEAPELPDVIDLEASATTLTLSAGATLNTGNTRSFLGNAGMRFNLLRGRHNFLAMGQGVYGQASLRSLDAEDPEAVGQFGDRETNARTITARVRYDYSVTLADAVYAGINTRHDVFAGMDVRVQNQVGYKRLLWGDKAKHFVSSEVGYDLTYDKLVDDGGDDLVHSVRLFAEYMNRISEYASFFTGFELLLDVEQSENVRFEWVSELQTTIYNQLKLGVNFAARFDNRPLDVAPGTPAEKLDTITTLNLVYDFDFERDKAAKAAKEAAAAEEAERRAACEEPCVCPDASEVCADWEGVANGVPETPRLDEDAGDDATGPEVADPANPTTPVAAPAGTQAPGREGSGEEVDDAVPLPATAEEG